ncbi:alpha/beta hydrolase [Mycobacterium sp. URHB0021]
MSVSVSTVEASNPDALTAAAGRLTPKIAAVDATIATQRAALVRLKAAWQGTGSDAAVAMAEKNLGQQEALRGRLHGLQSVLQNGGTQLSSARDGLLRIVKTLRAMGWTVSDDGPASAPRFPPILKLFEPGFTAVIQRLLQLYSDIDEATAGAVRTAWGAAPPAVPPGAPALPRPPEGASAEEVDRWWNSLSDEDRKRLLAAAPRGLGNLDGLPVEVRNALNTAVMDRDIARVDKAATANGARSEDVAAQPEKYGLTAADAIAYRNGLKTRGGLKHQAEADNPGRPRPVYLFGYDPLAHHGQGKAAVAIGNPDTADNIGVIVPGTGSSVSQDWLMSGRNDGVNLLDQMTNADPTKQNAVILWMGYETPDGFSDARIANPLLARDGGRLLAGDVNSLGVTHARAGAPNITVLGHSYGSTTVADAFAGSGMKASNAVLIGCPGTDLARDAGDFDLQGGQVYVANASTDPVGWIGASDIEQAFINGPMRTDLGWSVGLGNDPSAESFGATRFHAEVPGSGFLDTDDHSYYYTIGSESLYSMAAISSGHGDALAELGMLAEERGPLTVSTPDKIDTPLGEIDLPKIEMPVSPWELVDPESARDPGSITSENKFDGTNPV